MCNVTCDVNDKTLRMQISQLLASGLWGFFLVFFPESVHHLHKIQHVWGDSALQNDSHPKDKNPPQKNQCCYLLLLEMSSLVVVVMIIDTIAAFKHSWWGAREEMTVYNRTAITQVRTEIPSYAKIPAMSYYGTINGSENKPWHSLGNEKLEPVVNCCQVIYICMHVSGANPGWPQERGGACPRVTGLRFRE